MEAAFVSIIIPCYNYGNFLREAVNSVIEQSHSHWECLIIDDGSKDNTAEVAALLCKTDARVKYHHKQNGGLSSTRNYGIKLAKGDFICFLDADDLFDKKKLESQLTCFSQNASADIVYGNAMFFEKNDLSNLFYSKKKEAQSCFKQFTGNGHALIKLLVEDNMTVVSAPLIKNKVFARVGDFDLSYKSYEDWHFWLRCALANCRFVFCNEPSVCTYIRFGHESMMSDKTKLLRAGIQLRKYLNSHLPLNHLPYNFYRLLRSQIKLLLVK